MTRMPRIQQAVQEFFEREPCKGVHPDESVALGAGIQGSALVDDKQDMVLLDVTPHALGIMTQGGYFEELIPQNTTVPTHRTKIFTTSRENQTAVKIVVMQGESDRAEENELLGEFILTGLRRAAKGSVEIEVTFEINADGIVSVHAKDLETAKEQSIEVTASSGLTRDEIKNMIDGAKDYMVERRSTEELEAAKQEAERLIGEIERLFPQVEQIVAASDFGRDAIEKARAILAKARQAIAKRDVPAIKARSTDSRAPTGCSREWWPRRIEVNAHDARTASKTQSQARTPPPAGRRGSGRDADGAGAESERPTVNPPFDVEAFARASAASPVARPPRRPRRAPPKRPRRGPRRPTGRSRRRARSRSRLPTRSSSRRRAPSPRVPERPWAGRRERRAAAKRRVIPRRVRSRWPTRAPRAPPTCRARSRWPTRAPPARPSVPAARRPSPSNIEAAVLGAIGGAGPGDHRADDRRPHRRDARALLARRLHRGARDGRVDSGRGPRRRRGRGVRRELPRRAREHVCGAPRPARSRPDRCSCSARSSAGCPSTIAPASFCRSSTDRRPWR